MQITETYFERLRPSNKIHGVIGFRMSMRDKIMYCIYQSGVAKPHPHLRMGSGKAKLVVRRVNSRMRREFCCWAARAIA